MEKHIYNAASLAGVLQAFEDGYHVDSADFYRAHREHDESVVASIPASHRQAWAGFYAEWLRMRSSSSFSERVERELELA